MEKIGVLPQPQVSLPFLGIKKWGECTGLWGNWSSAEKCSHLRVQNPDLRGCSSKAELLGIAVWPHPSRRVSTWPLHPTWIPHTVYNGSLYLTFTLFTISLRIFGSWILGNHPLTCSIAFRAAFITVEVFLSTVFLHTHLYWVIHKPLLTGREISHGFLSTPRHKLICVSMEFSNSPSILYLSLLPLPQLNSLPIFFLSLFTTPDSYYIPCMSQSSFSSLRHALSSFLTSAMTSCYRDAHLKIQS